VIEQIAKDKRYKSICKKIAKRPELVDELYSEFLLAICEMGNDKLSDHKEHIEVYCVGIINNIWNKGHQITHKKNSNGKTSVFFNYCDYSIGEPSYVQDTTYDINIDICYVLAKRQLEADINSTDKNIMYKSRVYNYSINEYKNPLQFSKDSKIPYGAVMKQFNQYKERLKEILKKYKHD
jgi:hypothetical protein